MYKYDKLKTTSVFDVPVYELIAIDLSLNIRKVSGTSVFMKMFYNCLLQILNSSNINTPFHFLFFILMNLVYSFA